MWLRAKVEVRTKEIEKLCLKLSGSAFRKITGGCKVLIVDLFFKIVATLSFLDCCSDEAERNFLAK